MHLSASPLDTLESHYRFRFIARLTWRLCTPGVYLLALCGVGVGLASDQLSSFKGVTCSLWCGYNILAFRVKRIMDITGVEEALEAPKL